MRGLLETLEFLLFAAMMAFVLCAVLASSGCFWICRVPMLKHAQYTDDGQCTNCVWQAPIDMMFGDGWTNWTVYPLIGMRVYMTEHLSDGDEIPLDELRARFPERHYDGRDLYNIKWQRRFRWAQYGILWLGVPIDAAVDTVLLPFDVASMLLHKEE